MRHISMSTSTTLPQAFDPHVLPDDVRLLKDMIRELLVTLQKRDRELDGVRDRLDQLLRRLYGPRAEHWDPRQPLLFPEMAELLKQPEPELASQDSAKNGQAGKRRGHGRQQLPEHLPRKRTVLDVAEADKRCPCCGDARSLIGEDVSSRLDYEPASMFVAETVRPKYACGKCETGVVTAPLPPQTIDKGLPGPGLLAHVVVSKYADHLPLYRQEHMITRHGVPLSRSTLCDWMAQAADILRPLHERMRQEVLLSVVVNCDATGVNVQDETLPGKTRKAFFWTIIGDAFHPYRVFIYTPNQKGDGPLSILGGFAGWLQVDASTTYNALYRSWPGITEVGCWAHARRGFFDAKDSNPLPAHEALARIGRLYAFESESKKLTLGQRLLILADPGDAEQESRLAGIADYAERLRKMHERVQELRAAEVAWNQARGDAAMPIADRLACWDRKELLAVSVDHESFVLTRLKLRRFFSVPKLEALKLWLDQQINVADLPDSALGKAMAYAKNNWQALVRYTLDGALDIDNNVSERTLRQVAIGRKNWLFLGSDQGGKTAEVHISLVATCKALGIEPFTYLRDILTRLPSHPADRLDELLPDRWAQAQRRQLLEEEWSKPPPSSSPVPQTLSPVS